MAQHRQVICLAVVRDMGAANVVGPTAVELRRRGHKVLLFAEKGGKAGECLAHLNIPCGFVKTSEEVKRLVEVYNPNVVISGLSSPCHLELICDLEAAARGIPLVQIEDFWGVHTRSEIEPDLLVTIDDVAAALVRKKYSSAVQIVIAGSPGVSSVKPRSSLTTAFDEIHRREGRKIIVFTDGGGQCASGLLLLIECLKLTRIPWVLVPKFHPKFVSSLMPRTNKTWGVYWYNLLEPVRDHVYERDESTEEVVLAADATASAYSTLLITAAAAGKTALTLWTPMAAERLWAEAKLPETPLMMYRGFPVLRKPQPLDRILAVPPPTLDLKPFDARIAADAILALVA